MKRAFPGMELHASTQMTVTSVYSAKMLKEMGCCRVVPARELSLEEISRIYKETGMDIETFVHGALCYCYSGQCLMSSLIAAAVATEALCPAMPPALPCMGGRQGRGKELKQREPEVCIKFKRSVYAGYFTGDLRGRSIFFKDRRKNEEPAIYSRCSPHLQKISGSV